jgi:hypothetical protein
VAEATAIDAFSNSGVNSYNLSDTAANLAAASASVGNSAGTITATTGATVAQGIKIDAFTNSGVNTYNLSDTAANLAAAATGVGSGAGTITATTSATVAEATAIEATGVDDQRTDMTIGSRSINSGNHIAQQHLAIALSRGTGEGAIEGRATQFLYQTPLRCQHQRGLLWNDR